VRVVDVGELDAVDVDVDPVCLLPGLVAHPISVFSDGLY
jgi:hypothetical protein